MTREIATIPPLPDTDTARTIAASPERFELWDDAERVAEEEQRPDDVTAIYLHVLSKPLPRDVALELCERAAAFLSEWGEDSSAVIGVLTRALEIDAGAAWAFRKLTMLLTIERRFDELLAQYDRVLAAADDPARKIELLTEAAQVAKDLAGRADRAIAYLDALAKLRPGDAQIVASLERLLEREGRYRELVDLQRSRLDDMPEAEARALRAQIAACLLDKLDSPAEALDASEGLLDDEATAPAALDLLERAFAAPGTPAEVRGRALASLRAHYAAGGSTGEIIRVLIAAIAVADAAHAGGASTAGGPLDRLALHRDVAELLVGEGREAEAVEHYAALLVLDPMSDDAMGHLRELAERTARLDRYAGALAEAADALGTEADGLPARAVTLLFEAGTVRSDVLGDPGGAAGLYQRIFAAGNADPKILLDVCRRLDGLLQGEERRAERLSVLEKRASLEPEAALRRDLRIEAARIAEALGQADRALAAYDLVLAESPADTTAHDASIALLERGGRWAEMVTALRRASEAKDGRGRDLRVRAARVLENELGDPAAAIDEWIEIEARFGTDEETIDALVALLSAAERWLDLIAVLERGLEETIDAGRRIEFLDRLGHVYRERAGQPERALACYRAVLAEVPDHAGSRAGLTALLDDARCRPAAVALLLEAFEKTGDWAGRLSLLEHRLDLAEGAEARTDLLREAADLYEHKKEDPAAALVALARALPLAPHDTAIEERMLALADATGDHAIVARALGEAVAAGPEAARAADLHERRGGVLETHLGDARGALEAYLAAFELAPHRPAAAASVVRVAMREGAWDTAATAIVTSARVRGVFDRSLVGAYEGAAAAGAWTEAASALEAAVAADEALPPALAGELERRAAVWHRDHRGDADAAEQALTRALARAGDEIATLVLLADVQRRAPDARLVATLLRLADAGHEVTASLREAAVTALEVLRDAAQAASIFGRLLDELATELTKEAESLDLFAESVVTGPEEEDLAQQATFAVDRLVDLALAAGDHPRAVEILDRAAHLPLGEGPAIARLHQAATIAEERMDDPDRAIALLRTILTQAPANAPAIERLAGLFAHTGRTADLLELRRHELSLAAQVADRLRLRLDIAELLGRLGDEATRQKELRDNLAEEPAHEASLEEIARLLGEQGAHAELCGILEHEAEAIAERGEGGRAAALFTRASELAEQRLGDAARALAARTRAADFAPTPENFDALARLSTALRDHAAAVRWIEKRLEALPAGATADRIATVARLANAHIAAGKEPAARTALERGLAAHPGSEALREPLRALYRSAGAWDKLVGLLTKAGEQPPKVEHLREAADICLKKLGSRERAIPILEALTAQAPADKAARIALADALRATGALEPARAILSKLLEEYGRRKPPERAEVHTQLARIAQAGGDLDEARRQLETATAMNPEHPGALRLLGAVYRDAGELQMAERMFGALLLIAMRSPQRAEEPHDGPARSEAMILLHGVFNRLGQEARAQEMLTSAFEAAKASVHEARRLEEGLRAAGDPDLLYRALELRLARSEGPARAEVLAEMADVLAGPLGRHEEALGALLGALEFDPASAPLLAKAVTSARGAGGEAVTQCVETFERLAAECEAAGKTDGAAALLFALGDLCERDLQDPARALAAFTRAEALGADQVPVWRAIDRVAGAAGDPAAQIRVLRQLVFAADAANDPAALTEDIYRLAGLELASPADIAAGLGTLDWAMSREIRHDRAGAMLRRAAEAAPEDAAVLAAYERVARASEDRAMLLDALDRASAAPTATMDLLREAVELATAAGDRDRVTSLLGRAVALAESGATGMAEAAWALLALADIHEGAGDLAAAVDDLARAVEAAEREDALRYAARAAALARRLGDPGLGAAAYERLLERDRHDRDVWGPLLDLVREKGDRDALEDKLREAIECAFDAAWRIQLRRERAALLLDTRWEDAAAELSELLNEDDEDTAAALQLTQLYERHGRHDDLADLLDRRLSGARMRGDVATVLALSLQLGALVAPTNADRAIDVYRAALDSAPESVPLLTRLLALYPAEERPEDRADILERLLALSQGEEAVERALALADLREKMGDDEGTARALRRGREASPDSRPIRDRLAGLYRGREMWSELAEMLAAEGEALSGPESVARLREAAAVYLDKLDRPADAAQRLLLAASRAPDDLALLVDVARCLARDGREAEARERVGAAIAAGAGAPAERVALLRLRAELTTDPEQLAGAIADLEAAYALDPAVAPDLVDALERFRGSPSGSGDRAAWLRLFDVLLTLGRAEQARDLLGDWFAQEPGDVGVLRMAAFMDGLAGRWDQAVELCDRVVGLEEGAARVEAALLVADACVQAGYPAEARPVLEAVFRDNPGDAALRENLRRIYEQTESHRELAELSMAEAAQAADPAERFAALRRAGQLFIESVGDPEAAVAPLQAACELRPRDGDVAVMLADALITTNRLQEAANFLDAALGAQKGRRSREVSMMQQRMAAIAGAVGDRANEAGWLNAALDSDAQNADAAARLADVATELGQFDVAIKALKAIAMMKSPGPISRAMAYVRQALIAQHQGDVRKAVLLARKAQAEDPTLVEAQNLLAELNG